jgi:tetratricopeptide (TPR) repeat protein
VNEIKHCINESAGCLLALYSLDTLTRRETKYFERHLMECGYCREQLEQVIPVATVLRQDRARQLARLAEEKAGRHQSTTIVPLVLRALHRIWRFQVLVPVAGALVVLALITTMVQGNPYDKIITKEPLPCEVGLTYRRVSPTTQEQFDQGMSDYSMKQYDAAIRKFRLALQQAPDEGLWWLYLGVSYYLDRRPDEAIAALNSVNEPAQSPFNAKAQWYKANALLMKRKPVEALSLLNWQIEQNTRYANDAKSLISKVKAIQH